uniref:Uncharacterized protein n=1 Tax=viral metagenome TaxID=1070528 RepID=A0A6C0JGP4_9ZZZZ
MPKKHNSRRRLKGGWLDSLGQTFSSWGNSISQGASTAWEKTKNASSNMMTSSPSTPSTPSTYTAPTYTAPAPSPPTDSSNYSSNDGSYGSTGGKRLRKGARKSKRTRKVKRGGYRDNVSLTNLASSAAPFAGQTAKAHNLVGGKKRKRGTRRGRH